MENVDLIRISVKIANDFSRGRILEVSEKLGVIPPYEISYEEVELKVYVIKEFLEWDRLDELIDELYGEH